MTDPFTVAAIAVVFLLAGGVKGLIGLGLPTVSLGLLTVLLDLTTAMALLTLPAAATNLWQAAVGGNARMIVRRLWPFMLAATVTVWLGAMALTRVDLALLSALLGLILVAYAGLSLAGWRFAIPPRAEGWAGPLLGSVNGILTGMTGSFVVPGSCICRRSGSPATPWSRRWGSCSAHRLSLWPRRSAAPGCSPGRPASCPPRRWCPPLIGMAIGQQARRRLSEERFRRVFSLGILALGAYIFAAAALEGA